MQGRKQAKEDRQDADTSLAWHIVAFDRSKKLPNLRKILGRRDQPKTPQARAEMLATMRAWVGATNGPAGQN